MVQTENGRGWIRMGENGSKLNTKRQVAIKYYLKKKKSYIFFL